jgi:hypothetical protein
MANTFQHIQTVTVTAAGGAATIEFTAIPQTYTDLVLTLSARSTYAAAGDDLYLYFNGVVTNRSGRFVYGNGVSAAATSVSDHAGTMTADSATANVFGNTIIYFPNYTTANFKSLSSDSVSENNATTAYADLTAGLWSSTAAITSIQIPTAGGRGVWKQYSSASLYGIVKN